MPTGKYKRPVMMTPERRREAIELIKDGYSLNKAARAIGLSSANALHAFLKSDHPDVYELALKNGRTAKTIYRTGVM